MRAYFPQSSHVPPARSFTFVKQYVKDRAGGTCELCGKYAPFKTAYDEPYLEIHHLITLSDDGPDTIYNTVALCPNCHKKMHFGKISTDSKEYIKLVKLMLESLNNHPFLISKAEEIHKKQ